jgi:hypothetical protein
MSKNNKDFSHFSLFATTWCVRSLTHLFVCLLQVESQTNKQCRLIENVIMYLLFTISNEIARAKFVINIPNTLLKIKIKIKIIAAITPQHIKSHESSARTTHYLYVLCIHSCVCVCV